MKCSRSSGNRAFSMKAQTGLKAAKTEKKLRNKQVKPESGIGRPKRPLNSWMAFRSKS